MSPVRYRNVIFVPAPDQALWTEFSFEFINEAKRANRKHKFRTAKRRPNYPESWQRTVALGKEFVS